MYTKHIFNTTKMEFDYIWIYRIQNHNNYLKLLFYAIIEYNKILTSRFSCDILPEERISDQ